MADTESGKRKINIIYNYYERNPDKKSCICKVCKIILSTPRSITTTTLQEHLKKHPTELRQYENEKKKLTLQNPRPTPQKRYQLTMKEVLFKKTKLASNAPKAQSITKSIALMLTKSLLPYTFVEESGFVEFMANPNIAPQYEIPSRTTFSTNYVPKLFADTHAPQYEIPSRTTFSTNYVPKLFADTQIKMKGVLKLDLPSLLSLSITSDGWTSAAVDKYVSVTCHYLRTDFTYNSFTMDTILMNESNTSKNIGTAIKLTLEEWELPVQESSIPIYCVTDNGANFKSAASIYFIHRQCFAHTLQNAISDSKRETPGVITLLSKCKAIVGHYRRSSSAKQRLHNIQKQLNLKQLEVVQYVDTRWSSEFAMLKRLIEIQSALNAELASPHNTSDLTMLTAQDWRHIHGLVEILQPLTEATEELSGDSYPTSSMVIPVLHCLESHLNKCIVKKIEGIMFARNLSKSIKLKFVVYEEDTVYLLSMLIDPRFRGVLVNKIVAVANLQAEVNKYRSFKTQPLEEQPGPSTTTSSLWSAIDELPNESLFDSVTDEIERYLGEKRIPRREDPFIWWKEKGQHTYPSLAKLAAKYLGIPATQVSSERLFSTAGNIVTERRQNLLPAHVRQLVFLHDNL